MKKKYFLNLIILFALLSYGYYYFFHFIQNFSNKIGFPLDPNIFKMFEAIILLGMVAAFYFKYDINESIYLTYSNLLYTFILFPLGVYYWMSNSPREYMYMQFASFLLLNLIYAFFIKLREKDLFSKFNLLKNIEESYIIKKASSVNIYKIIFLMIILTFIILDLIIYKKYGNSIYYLFNLDKVYSIRLQARGIVPGRVSYIISWSAYVVIAACIAWCIKTRKYILIIVPILIQILLFTVGGNKSHLFGLVLTIVIFILFSQKQMYYFTTLLNFAVAGSLILNNKFLMAIVIRRTFFVPASTSYAYYQLFSESPKMMLSNSILSRFFTNPYKLDASFIVSRYIYRLPDMSSNSNYIANAYSNFGFWGIIVFTLILAGVFLVTEYISFNNKHKEYIILITFGTIFVLTNSALLTTLSNHGLFIAVIISFMFIKAINYETNSEA